MSDAIWSIIVHGGARPIPEHSGPKYRAGCLAAVEAGAAILAAGGSALDAAVEAVRLLENDPTFNAGHGGALNADGEVECDAAVMTGRSLKAGAVAAVKRIRNPVLAALALLEEREVMLVAEGAERFAREKGLAMCDPADLFVERDRKGQGADTVGCVALDAHGEIVAATSTGGQEGFRVGRVGDSPLLGSGLYADNQVGGVALSGDGEALMRTAFAARVMFDLEAGGGARAVAEAALGHLSRIGAEAGLILIDRHGQIGWDHNSPQFSVAWATHDQPPCAFLERREDQREDDTHG